MRSVKVLVVSFTSKSQNRTSINNNKANASIVNENLIFGGKSITTAEGEQLFSNADHFTSDNKYMFIPIKSSVKYSPIPPGI